MINPDSREFTLLGVIGKPVLHSQSPRLHQKLLENSGRNGAYVRLAAETVDEALQVAREIGMTGLNVTAPFKEEAFELSEVRSDRAIQAKAANTICFNGVQSISSENTDIMGIELALKSILEGAPSRAVVLGAGGAARAAVIALKNLGVSSVIVLNRTVARAKAIAEELQVEWYEIESEAAQEALSSADTLINCVSSQGSPIPVQWLHIGLTVLDAQYALTSDLLSAARSLGCRAADGLEWFLAQGQSSFALFTGDTSPPGSISLEARRDPRPESIALIGFMGSGKTTVGRLLAQLRGVPAFDLDELIEKETARTIPAIFSEDGEESFRRLEHEALISIDPAEPHVLACGGGVVTQPHNVEWLKANYRVFWLWASPSAVDTRTAGSSERPLLGGENRLETISNLLTQRIPTYAQTCELVIGTAGKSPQSIAERLEYEISLAK